MSHSKNLSATRTILTWAGLAVGLVLLAGCDGVSLTDLTPASLQENPSEIYTFTLRVAPSNRSVSQSTVVPHLVIDGQNFTMHPSSLGDGVYEFDYQLPPGRQEVAYYYLVDYQVSGDGTINSAQAYTGVQHASIVHRYVLTIEADRGPVGASVAILGRGFTPQDAVLFNGTPVRSVYASSTSLSFYVPPMPAGIYQVSLASPSGNAPVGSFRIDATSVSASPSSLDLAAGQQETLTFTLSSPAPSGGLLLDVTTDVPDSVIMPEVTVPAGETSVSVPVQGGRPGTGSLVLKGYGEGLTIPVTVH